jgi:hypothetical protein
MHTSVGSTESRLTTHESRFRQESLWSHRSCWKKIQKMTVNDSKWFSKKQWKIVTIMKNAPILLFSLCRQKIEMIFEHTRYIKIVTFWVLTCVHWSHFRSHFFPKSGVDSQRWCTLHSKVESRARPVLSTGRLESLQPFNVSVCPSVRPSQLEGFQNFEK